VSCEVRLVARVVAVWALVGALGGSAYAADQPRIERARAELLDDSYQTQFPGDEAASIVPHQGSGGGSGGQRGHAGHAGHAGQGNRGNGRRDPHDRLDGRDRRFTHDGEDPSDRDTRRDPTELNAGPLASLFNALLWGVVIVAIGILIFWLASELFKYGGDDAQLASEEASAGASSVDLAVIQRPLGDAEELAARGEYREAIHTLLLRTLQELVRSSAVRVGPALTSREILGRVPLAHDARDALQGLIVAVELTHFGGDEAIEEDYVRCRAQFQKFAIAFRASAPRGTGTALGATA
jgi:hypothetical protein